MNNINSVSSELVVKANNLIEGFMDMTQQEYKFTLFLISRIRKEDKEFHTQKVSVKEFANVINYTGGNMYEYMKGFESSLASKKIRVLYENGDRLNIPWFGFIRYIHKEGILEVAFNYHLSPFLLNIDIPYTKYYLENIKGLNSIYSLRVYELLKQYQKIGTRIIQIDELKLMLGISPEEYKLYGDFKRRVILQAQKELAAKTDMIFEYTEIKIARRIDKIKFEIYSNVQPQLLESSEEKKLTQAIKTDFKKLYKGELNINIIQSMIDKKGFEHVRQTLNELKDYIGQSQIKHIERFFYRCVMDDYTKSTSYTPKLTYANFDQREYTDENWEEIIRINQEKYTYAHKIEV
ncbi:MAG: hypothetical protein ACD_26C00137G0004 [uncultured bacterium]|nr:MAG: hypothetical protein ACD_26C00137G0004 [uncultured bacterium]